LGAQGLHGLQGLAAAHGLQGLHGFAAAQGLQGLAAAQGLQGLAAAQGFAQQGLQGFGQAALKGLQAAIAAPPKPMPAWLPPMPLEEAGLSIIMPPNARQSVVVDSSLLFCRFIIESSRSRLLYADPAQTWLTDRPGVTLSMAGAKSRRGDAGRGHVWITIRSDVRALALSAGPPAAECATRSDHAAGGASRTWSARTWSV
jgi:hypothetical protein